MSHGQRYPHPEVFLVDGRGSPQPPVPPPGLVPCWMLPTAQERARGRGKSRGCTGLSVVFLLLFLLVFAALGLGAHQIYKLQVELNLIQQNTEVQNGVVTPEKQVGFKESEVNEVKDDVRPAAHLIGRVSTDPSRQTLRWEPRAGRAFSGGGVWYRVEDGALQVNHTGLYYIYSRVELLLPGRCTHAGSPFLHTVFVRRASHRLPLILMRGQRALCGPGREAESFLGAALQLQKDDRVMVNVSHPTLLSHDHHANFFGLYKI